MRHESRYDIGDIKQDQDKKDVILNKLNALIYYTEGSIRKGLVNFDAQDNRFIGMPASLVRSFYFESDGVRIGRGPMVDASGNAFGNGNRVRGSRVGDTIVMENTQGPPNNAPATQAVTLTNFASAALYRYTPHVYNGNYNFSKFFNEWFKYPNGTLIQVQAGSQVYVIDNGLKRPISSFVMNQRGLDPVKVVTVSALEFSEFTDGEVMTPSDGSLLKNSIGQIFLMEGGARRRLSSFVAVQRKLDLGQAVVVSDQEILSYRDGGVALPKEGTLVKSRENAAVYVITNNEKRLLTAFVFKQRTFLSSDILTAEPGELDTYPSGSIMPPLDGTLVKSQTAPAVYHVGNGLLEPLTYFVFQQRGFKFSSVISVPAEELAQWSVGKPMPPETGAISRIRSAWWPIKRRRFMPRRSVTALRTRTIFLN